MTLPLVDDQMCYACGSRNPQGLRLSFTQPKKGHIETFVTFAKEHQGFKDIVHGGMVGLVLDEVIVNLLWKEGIAAVTGELTVRLKKPVPVGEKIRFEGRLDREDGRLLYGSASAHDARGTLLASASATCVRVRTPKT